MKYTLFKLANTQINLEEKHSSPEVSQIISIVKEMVNRGAPTEYNDMGFNKLDYSNPIITYVNSVTPNSPLSWKTIFETLRILKKYKNTQLQSKNIDEIDSKLNNQLNNKYKIISDLYSNPNSKIIKKLGNGSFGKDLYFIGGLEKDDIKEIINLISNHIDNIKSSNPSLYSKFSPNINGEKPIFKIFSKQSIQNLYEIHPSFEHLVIEKLKSMGYSSDEQGLKDTPSITKRYNPLEITKSGNNYDISFSFNRALVDAIKAGDPRTRSYNPQSRSWTLFSPSKNYLKNIAEVAGKEGFDKSKFDQAISDAQDNEEITEPTTDKKIKLRCRKVHAETNGNWLISIFYLSRGSNPAESAKIDSIREMFNESIKFCFVNFTDNINNNDPDIHTYIGGSSGDPRFKYQRLTRGDLNDYARFIQCCKTMNFDTSEMENAVNELINEGVIEKLKIDGEIDGFSDMEDFKKKVSPFEDRFRISQNDPELKINQLQYHGMQFLYSRSSALLGDETGTGKTIQSIVAAQLRLLKENNIPFDADMSKAENYNKITKRCLVFTVNSVVNQFSENVSKITGIPIHKISNSWEDENSPWQILSYNVLSKPTMAIPATKFLRAMADEGKYAICVLDECHNVKNGSPTSRDPSGNLNHKSNKQTFNCQEITQHIPYVWGLSATIIANKPIDIYNQLRSVNHPLGRLNYRGFKANFDPPTKTTAEKFANADKLRKILIMQRLYIQRTKKMMREDLPNIIVAQKDAQIDSRRFNDRLAIRLGNYKAKIPVTDLIGVRTELAVSKVPETLKFAKSILDSGKKVAIFTAFSEAADPLVLGLKSMLAATGDYVAEIRGGQTSSSRAATIRAFKNDTSKYRAIVINITAGGTGIDFPNILTDVIFNDYDWSPAKDEQARGRFFRINSKNDVYTHYVIAADTADEIIFDRVKTKIAIMERIQKLEEEQINRIVEGKYNITDDDMEKNELQARLEAIEEDFDEFVDNVIKSTKKEAKGTSWIKIARKEALNGTYV